MAQKADRLRLKTISFETKNDRFESQNGDKKAFFAPARLAPARRNCAVASSWQGKGRRGSSASRTDRPCDTYSYRAQGAKGLHKNTSVVRF
jgi:hypothetical protein